MSNLSHFFMNFIIGMPLNEVEALYVLFVKTCADSTSTWQAKDGALIGKNHNININNIK